MPAVVVEDPTTVRRVPEPDPIFTRGESRRDGESS